VKKTKGYSLGKTEKNERFSQRRRLSQKAHQTTAFDLQNKIPARLQANKGDQDDASNL
jgi:hypothetical protein